MQIVHQNGPVDVRQVGADRFTINVLPTGSTCAYEVGERSGPDALPLCIQTADRLAKYPQQAMQFASARPVRLADTPGQVAAERLQAMRDGCTIRLPRLDWGDVCFVSAGDDELRATPDGPNHLLAWIGPAR